jgi:hypothetical protein
MLEGDKSLFWGVGRMSRPHDSHENYTLELRKTIRKDHRGALTTAHDMALVFDRQGQYGKATEWYGGP